MTVIQLSEQEYLARRIRDCLVSRSSDVFNLASLSGIRNRRLKFGRNYIIVSDLHSQFFCEAMLDNKYCAGGVVADAESLSSDDRVVYETKKQDKQLERATGSATHVEIQSQATDGSRGAVIGSELSLVSIYTGVLLVGKSDLMTLSLDGYGIIITEYKSGTSPDNDPWIGDLVQALTYCYSLDFMLTGTEIHDMPISAIVEYRSSGRRYPFTYCGIDHPCIPARFSYPKTSLRNDLDFCMSYWKGERSAKPTKVRNKCASCEYHMVCRFCQC